MFNELFLRRVQLRNKADQVCLEEIVSYMPGNVYWTDKSGKYLGCNENVAKVLKLNSTKDIVGKTIHELIVDKKIADEVEKIDAEVIRNNKEVVSEQEAFDAEGSWAVYFTRKLPLHDETGKVNGVLGVSLDITERKLAEKALVKAKEQAESANRAKTEFLANMSHDVKTPMVGIMGVADLMMHNPAWCTPEKAAMIHASALQVLHFFNNCLELSKLEMTEWDVKEEELSLKSLLDEMSTLFMPQSQSKGLDFTVSYDEKVPEQLLGSRASLYRVILNLVGNALKFTQKGEIHLRVFLKESLSEDAMLVGIEVKDTGIGIPEDKQTIIFEKLRRLTPSYEGKIEGSGIGLYIVDQYVKRMGGRVHVKSTPGEGSVFTVLLPMQVAVPTIESNTEGYSISSSSSVEIKKTARILLVEDNAVVQMVTKNLLNDIGFSVDVASTGAEAVEVFSPEKYELVFMDIGLPDIDGYEVTRTIRQKERAFNTEKTPIVALTGHAALDVQSSCKEVGMQGVISKPIQRHQIEGIWQSYGESKPTQVEGLIVL